MISPKWGRFLKDLYLLSFYSFLRFSNLVPHAVTQFLPLKHLARGDIIFRHYKIVVMVKCTKTMQDQVKLLIIPAISRSKLCPVSAISNLLCLTPKGKNLPNFQVKNAGNWVPLNDGGDQGAFFINS